MKRSHQPDYILISIVFILIFIGLIILSSASVVISQDNFNESYYYLKHQLFYGVLLGFIFFFIIQRIDYRHWQKYSFLLMVSSLVFLALVFVPGIGYSHGGARRWIVIGSVSIQPFEFVKLISIIYFATLLSKKGEIKEVIKKSIIPCLVIMSIIAFLVLSQPNTSDLGIIVLIILSIYFLAGMRISYLIGAALFLISLFYILIKTNSYRMSRLTVFLHPETDPQGKGYQINQALLAIGSGGLFGLGLGHSIQKWKYLPEVIGDSIFAIAAEELGLIGVSILVLLFIALVYQGLKIAKNAPDRFGYLLAGGITSWFFLQAFVNIMAITGLIPLTGMPLPFISYGGTALIISLIGIGILVNISKYTKI